MRPLARTVPTNYILLGIFTFSMAYFIAFFCGYANEPLIVLAAVTTTCAVVLALFIYAITTKTDMSVLLGSLWILTTTMLMYLLFFWFIRSYWLQMIYYSLGLILFGIYLIIDVKLIIGDKQGYGLSVDDYIIGAMMIYSDIIMIFLYILSIFVSSTR